MNRRLENKRQEISEGQTALHELESSVNSLKQSEVICPVKLTTTYVIIVLATSVGTEGPVTEARAISGQEE